ncbi:MAG: TolC family protein [Thermodesulfobacteriota bacterium]|nr:TolC family protein [Thermodesulfobacteriota bacterium]
MLIKRITPILELIIILMLIPSCAVFSPKERTESFLNLPKGFTMYDEGIRGPDRWWESFRSSELDALINMAIKDNLTIAETYARVEQAWASAVKQGAARWLELDTSISSSVSRNKRANALGEKTEQSHLLGLTAGYELDLWSRIKSIHKSSRLDLEAAQEDAYTSAITISAEIAETWLSIIAVERKLSILKKQMKTNETMLELTMLRYRKGQSTALDVFQQKQTLAKNRASFPQLQAKATTLRHELTLLLGKPSGYRLNLKESYFPNMPKMPETGIPADLLAKRPDVRKAGLKLKSAEWLVSAAKADRLPSIKLTASYTYVSDKVSNIFDNWIANLAGSIIGPIFDSGARKAEVRRTQAVVKERLAAYKKTVLSAINEVEDSMTNEKKQAEYISALREQYEATLNTYKQALEYYRKGTTGYINVLESLNALQSLELGLVDAEKQHFQYRIGLYRSLGGNWMRGNIQIRIEEKNRK